MIPKLALSITSFSPLYLLMVSMYAYVYTYENINEITKKYVVVSIAVIMVVQLICTIVVNRYIKSKESSTIAENEVTFDNIKEDKKAYVNYMMTYLLPLLTFDLDKVKCFYIVYTNILVLMFIFMNARAENFNFNIFLWMRGYYIYKGALSDGSEKTLLIKKKKFSNFRSNYTRYKFVSFGAGNDIYLCKKYNE